MPAPIWEKAKNHPCYSEEAHHHYARMQAVAEPEVFGDEWVDAPLPAYPA